MDTLLPFTIIFNCFVVLLTYN